jgi:hypothetical protein
MSYFEQNRNSSMKKRTALKDGKPWINFEAREFLNKIIDSEMKVFEYGSGGSTLYFLDYVKELVTIEHDKDWFDLVIKHVGTKNSSKHTFMFIPPTLLDNPVENPDYSDPQMYLSSDEAFINNYSFYNYVSSIDKYENNCFDFISVDGRARPSCIKHAIPKLKINGYLMVDNSDREYYFRNLEKEMRNLEKVFEVFGPGPYGDIFWGTNFYKRKS